MTRSRCVQCPELFPVSVSNSHGLDYSYRGADAVHVLKGSFDDDWSDIYALGTYNSTTDQWTPFKSFSSDLSTWPRQD